MSKTVLLPDELHYLIQNTDIIISWSHVEMSMAKKIKLFFDVYRLENMVEQWEETLESFKTKNREVWDKIKDENIRWHAGWENPWLIK